MGSPHDLPCAPKPGGSLCRGHCRNGPGQRLQPLYLRLGSASRAKPGSWASCGAKTKTRFQRLGWNLTNERQSHYPAPTPNPSLASQLPDRHQAPNALKTNHSASTANAPWTPYPARIRGLRPDFLPRITSDMMETIQAKPMNQATNAPNSGSSRITGCTPETLDVPTGLRPDQATPCCEEARPVV